MRRLPPTVVIVLALFLIAAAKKDEQAKSDKEKLQGAWTIVTAEFDGKSLKEALRGTITFIGDKVEQAKHGDNGAYQGTYKLDESTNPKRIDLIPPTQGKVMAIYVLDRDELKISNFRPPETKRPSEFAAAAGTNQMLMIFKRVK